MDLFFDGFIEFDLKVGEVFTGFIGGVQEDFFIILPSVQGHKEKAAVH